MNAAAATPTLSAPPAPPRIGPNAVVQTLAALEELEGATRAGAIARDTDLAEVGLSSMIPEAWFVRLVEAVRAELPAARAEAVLREAGRRTAAYVATHRIPGAAKAMLKVLPGRLARPILLRAIRAHAWTFAGAGTFALEGGRIITLEGAPTCRGPGPSGARRGAYYAAAFEGLLHLADRTITVREVTCQAEGAPKCRFALDAIPPT
jgi:divinyl protochlorophyllide a 8-vinyl-reductase